METNLFEELKKVLEDFKEFLDENADKIRPAIQALAGIFSEIVEVLDLLIGLMNDLKTEIQNLDVSDIDGLEEASQFIDNVIAFLEASKNLLPEQGDTIDEILRAASVVGSLPSLEELKAEILDLITAITQDLESLKPA